MTSRLWKRLRLVLRVGGVLASGALAVAAYTTRQLNRPRRPSWRDEFAFTPWELQVPHERVEFASADGITLRGWWFPSPGATSVVVGCTGHRGIKHELLGIGSGLWRAGHNVLLFDFRGCGESDPAPISLAHKEVPDARAAVAFARRRIPGCELRIIGYSMGAAIAIVVAAEDPGIRAVVADSSFATIKDVLAFAFRQHRVPTHPLLELTDLLNRWRHGYPLSAVRPIDVVGRIAPRPILIVHGREDRVTAVEDAERLFRAAGEPKELWIVDGARHCGAYFVDREEYVSRVSSFFAHALEVEHAHV